MPKPVKGPLGLEHLKLLNSLLQECAETARLCQQCDQCNINVDKEAARNREQMDIATKLKATFFPNHQ